ncbi:MAG: hypothetical protein CL920_32055 [Deltaproteobacteria bacterium]|nr:hypothetical protein [Deltaproteobacteria bacterium]MBU53355.1 hypothetical protein [Deltaproteobacteria bacterium]|tara:strand:+ start:4585 stop:5211 length:627 start_codon:yes stop_codon:yes gene_type:complete
MRNIILWSSLLLVLIFANGVIYMRERSIRSGKEMYVSLLPRDPRSLIQGDYMVLRDQVSSQANRVRSKRIPPSGKLVVRVANNHVARFMRFDNGKRLSVRERYLRYKQLKGKLSIGVDAFFFQEGMRKCYQNGVYGILKVEKNGTATLVGLADRDRKKLGPNHPKCQRKKPVKRSRQPKLQRPPVKVESTKPPTTPDTPPRNFTPAPR